MCTQELTRESLVKVINKKQDYLHISATHIAITPIKTSSLLVHKKLVGNYFFVCS